MKLQEIFLFANEIKQDDINFGADYDAVTSVAIFVTFCFVKIPNFALYFQIQNFISQPRKKVIDNSDELVLQRGVT